MPESCVPVTIVTGRGLIIVRLQDFRYGQMVALFGSPLVCKQWGKKSDDYFVFPIVFAKVYGAWSICTSNDWARISELTTSRVKSSQNNGFVFAIGI